MNNQIKNTLRIGVIAAASAAAMLSCSDTWDDHYNDAASVLYNGTTMQAIEAEAPDFAEVIKAVGYDRELNSENVYTIWAPTHFDKAQMLALARTDSAMVVDRFIKNHIARYAVSQNGVEDQRISLMNEKITTMTVDNKFGTANITKANLSCQNGILHVIDSEIEYQKNVFEQIEALYNADTDSISLYAFLKIWNADSLDENKSVSRGVDENGEKIWVDSVMIRNNTVLKNMHAYIYREDSNYVAIIPSAKAYAERYRIAKDLLVFNPKENEGQEEGRLMDTTDSLQMHYANLFASTDLFYNMNKSSNEHFEDSLKSTQYSQFNWPNHLYYSNQPTNGLHPDKSLNNILSKVGEAAPCSNGKAYMVDEYPMTAIEQFFYKINVEANSRTMVTEEENSKLTHNIGSPSNESGVYYESIVNEEGDTTSVEPRTYHFMDVPTAGSSFNIEVGFKVPNTLSGTYDIYIVTCPIWAKDYGFRYGMTPEDDPRPYKFTVSVFERGNEKGKSTFGEYPASGVALSVPGQETRYFTTDINNYVDTLYLGEYTFKNAYYGRADEGVILKVESNVTSAEERRKTYSREMLISGFILRPKLSTGEEAEEVVVEAEAAEEAKRK